MNIRLALATTDGAAEQAASDRADDGAGDAVLVFDRRLMLHDNILAFLAWRLHRLGGFAGRHDFGEYRLGDGLIADTAGSQRGDGDPADNRTELNLQLR